MSKLLHNTTTHLVCYIKKKVITIHNVLAEFIYQILLPVLFKTCLKYSGHGKIESKLINAILCKRLITANVEIRQEQNRDWRNK